MIRGHQVFVEHFADFQDCYVVIGGVAVDAHLDSQGLTFRATKDFDIILVIEMLRPAFFEHFWQFIRDGEYQRKEVIAGPKQYYRFINPEQPEYPYQIELFSKRPDVIPHIEDHHLVPIPIDSDISSLSAILMDEAYYDITRDNVVMRDGLSIASEPLLICLKIKAFIDLSQRKREGQRVDSRDIKKHQNDVFRLGVTLSGQEQMIVPEYIYQDILTFYSIMDDNQPDLKSIFKNMGINTTIKAADVLEVFRSILLRAS